MSVIKSLCRDRMLVPTSLSVACFIALAPALAATAVDPTSAIKLLSQPGAPASAAFASAQDSWVVRRQFRNHDGSAVAQLGRYHGGLRVNGTEVDLVLAEDGRLISVNTFLTRAIQWPSSLTPTVSSISAREMARRDFASSGGQVASVSEPELMIDAINELVRKPALAWSLRVSGHGPCGSDSEMKYEFDAQSGVLLSHNETIESPLPPGSDCRANAAGAPRARNRNIELPMDFKSPGAMRPGDDAQATGHGLYAGPVTLNTNQTAPDTFALPDLTRGSHFVTSAKTAPFVPMVDDDNVWGTGNQANVQTVAVDIAYDQRVAWDYYLNVHQRQGIDGTGRGGYSIAHYSVGGRPFNNAQWVKQCFCMRYGDGDGVTFKPFVSIDIGGHEMTHGVTNSTANLDDSDEPGALNESTSDIFGTMIEAYARNLREPPNWDLGNLITVSGRPLRQMYHQSLDGASADCWYPGVGNLDSHLGSGIGNHFFYLLAQGSTPAASPSSPTCLTTDERTASGDAFLPGIGSSTADAIWYEALTHNFQSGTDYHKARLATLKAATTLYGQNSDAYRAVDLTWANVGISDAVIVNEVEGNATPEKAQVIPLQPALVLGHIGKIGGKDWMSLSVPAGTTLTATLTPSDHSTNFDLFAYDPDGTTLIGSSNEGLGKVDVVTVSNTSSGTARQVLVEVTYVNGKGNYTLRLESN